MLREGISFLRGLMATWSGILLQRQDGEALELSTMDALHMDVHHLEGFALAMLCSHDEHVRREAMQVRTGKPCRYV